ncbi:MAG: hypothetical protein LBC74_06150, partial [Planctomycetaceae bacterium]|nr:hypothetical protein [Planctomycetaceae bacterium]
KYSTIEKYKGALHLVEASNFKGIIVIFDEFGKYLENSAHNLNTKFLQDFAEFANRQPNLNLLLITHRSLSNYGNNDELRKIEGRFNELSLHNGFDTIYVLIEQILKRSLKWNNYNPPKDRYPLHDNTMFLLPRISELVAQNERTMFTFLASHHKWTLHDFIQTAEVGELITPDFLWDYFELQFRKENTESIIYEQFDLVNKLVDSASESNKLTDLQLKIIKTIALIYIAGYFESLPPTYDVIEKIYGHIPNFHNDFNTLKDNKYIIYESVNDGYLSIRRVSSIDIKNEIVSLQLRTKQRPVDILNEVARRIAVYPYRYNDEKHITRYWRVCFVDKMNLAIYNNNLKGDGIIVCEYGQLNEKIHLAKNEHFLKSSNNKTIDEILLKYGAVTKLQEKAYTDSLFYNELEFIKQDLLTAISNFTSEYLTNSQLSEKISQKSDNLYQNYPIYNYELLNRNILSTTMLKSRNKVIEFILENGVNSAKDVPESWTKQELLVFESFKASLEEIANKEILERINKHVENNSDFKELYEILVQYESGFGIRLGALPLYFSYIFSKTKHPYTKFYHNEEEIPLSANLFDVILNSVQTDKDNWTYSFTEHASIEKLNKDLKDLSAIFEKYIIEQSDPITPHIITNAIERWRWTIPQLTVNCNKHYEVLFSVVEKQISKPTQFLLNDLKNIENLVGKSLPEIKMELDNYLNRCYAKVAERYLVGVNEVDKVSKLRFGLKLKDLNEQQFKELLTTTNYKKVTQQKNIKPLKLTGFAEKLNNVLTSELKEFGDVVAMGDKLKILEQLKGMVENGIL